MSIFSRATNAVSRLLGPSVRAITLGATSQNNKILAAVNQVLKLDAFEERRKIAQEKVKFTKDEFLLQVAQNLETGHLANSREIQELLFLAEREDLDLVLASLKKLGTQSSQLRLSDFHIDATAMRLFYFLNSAELACATFQDPFLRTAYTGHTSALILLQLLFKNALYSQILECIDLLEERQSWNVWSSFAVAVFYMVSCLHLNTADAHRKAVRYYHTHLNYRKPDLGPALTAAYCAVRVDPSKVDDYLKFESKNEIVNDLKFNILLQLLVKEKQLVLVLDMLEDCSHTITKDTVDIVLAAIGGEGAADLESFITNHVKVCQETLPQCLIEFCLDGGEVLVSPD